MAWELEAVIRHRVGSVMLDFSLATAARVLSLEGPSGAGKSTVLRVLAGLCPSPHSTVRFRGVLWQDGGRLTSRPAWQRPVGWLPQDSLLLPHLTVAQNLRYGRRAADASPEEIWGLAEALGIGTLLTRFPRSLSGGERQRVALGRTLLARPELLLLDEPFAALDEARRQAVGQVVRDWALRHGQTVVIVSHQRADAEGWAGERWTLAEGRLFGGEI